MRECAVYPLTSPPPAPALCPLPTGQAHLRRRRAWGRRRRRQARARRRAHRRSRGRGGRDEPRAVRGVAGGVASSREGPGSSGGHGGSPPGLTDTVARGHMYRVFVLCCVNGRGVVPLGWLESVAMAQMRIRGWLPRRCGLLARLGCAAGLAGALASCLTNRPHQPLSSCPPRLPLDPSARLMAPAAGGAQRRAAARGPGGRAVGGKAAGGAAEGRPGGAWGAGGWPGACL